MPAEPFNTAALPVELRDKVGRWLDEHANELSPACTADDLIAGELPRVVACSNYVADCLARYPQALLELTESGRLRRRMAAGELLRDVGRELAGFDSESTFNAGLRRARHRELVRIAWRDLAGLATCDETLLDLSALADAAIGAALAWAEQSLEERFGRAVDEAGQPLSFGVVAMGKLGGDELNFSSDVDLVFVYSGPGTTTGRKTVSAEEYFRQLAQRLIASLSNKTSDGFAYRVDTRLRPFGDSGPLAISVAALEDYLAQHGRDWERYAYVKARFVNTFADADYVADYVFRPFVYRSYIDFGVLASLRDMKAMIDAEVERKDLRNNVKLGRGGIREIEFIAQSMQLIRGGTLPALRRRRLFTALRELGRADCLPADTVRELTVAYEFLRLFENRLQAISDRQTHNVPEDDVARAQLALAMRYPSWHELSAELDRQRNTVAAKFRHVAFRGGESAASTATSGDSGDLAAWLSGADDELLDIALRANGCEDPDDFAAALRRFRDGGQLRRLDEAGRARLVALIPAVIAMSREQTNPQRALVGTLSVIESIGRRSTYFALLNENPDALERLIRLCALSDFLSRQLAAHPLLLDELLDQRVFLQAPERREMQDDLDARMRAAGDDPEQQRHALLNFHQSATFRVAVADLSDVLTLMRVSDRLTDIAELSIQAALDIAWQELSATHGEPRCSDALAERPVEFAVIAYGKLGGLELGYGSDLDLVFLNDSDGDAQTTNGPKPVENSVFFARLARRLIHILTMPTMSGSLYEVDMRLRPSGRSGMLVSSLTAFERYQREDAWTWEHQALLRSRPVAGSTSVAQEFAALRQRALMHFVDGRRLRADVVDMRRRMRDELGRGTAELFDLKQDQGGLTDIEFLVQFLVLRDARKHPELIEYSDNVRQIDALVQTGSMTSEVGATLADTYRAIRSRLHRLSLAGANNLVPRVEVAAQAESIVTIWQQTLG